MLSGAGLSGKGPLTYKPGTLPILQMCLSSLCQLQASPHRASGNTIMLTAITSLTKCSATGYGASLGYLRCICLQAETQQVKQENGELQQQIASVQLASPRPRSPLRHTPSQPPAKPPAPHPLKGSSCFSEILQVSS